MTLDGEPWFVAADVCRALGIHIHGTKVNGADATRKLAADERRVTGSDLIHPWPFDPRAKGITLVTEGPAGRTSAT